MVKIIDLSLDISPAMKLASFMPKPEFTRTHDHYDDPLLPFIASTVKVFLHTGTHMDAPMHTQRGGRSIDKVDPSVLYGDAVKLDLSSIAPSQEITLDDIRSAEATLDSPIQVGDFVILATLYNSRHWGNDDYFTRSPFASAEVAEYLILEKGARGLGYDFIQEKYVATKPLPEDIAKGKNLWPIHQIVLGNDRYHVEYLTNLESVTQSRFKIVVAPLKWVGLEASPVRVFAILDG
jgi:kynurenine formamidase